MGMKAWLFLIDEQTAVGNEDIPLFHLIQYHLYLCISYFD